MNERILEKDRLGEEVRTYETTSVVSFAGASKSCGDVRAVDRMDLSIKCGETVALLGPNGAD